MMGLVMFAVALLMLLAGFPVAFTFGGVAVFLAY
jgi:TRAP-type mannitol/chloroaromatic compound transport system permease large subunit